MNNFKKLLESELSEKADYTVKKRGSTTVYGDPDDYGHDIKTTMYDVYLDGIIVGELETQDFTGSVNGTLHNKGLPEISGFSKGGKLSNPQQYLHRFLKTKTGKKWMSNIHKYMK